MTDRLAEMWNEQNPDRPIELIYIPHTEMVPKLAQAIAAGDPPDLMGLDLIYGPQFEATGTTRTDMSDNEYFQANEDVQDVTKAIAVAQTPYTSSYSS